MTEGRPLETASDRHRERRSKEASRQRSQVQLAAAVQRRGKTAYAASPKAIIAGTAKKRDAYSTQR